MVLLFGLGFRGSSCESGGDFGIHWEKEEEENEEEEAGKDKKS